MNYDMRINTLERELRQLNRLMRDGVVEEDKLRLLECIHLREQQYRDVAKREFKLKEENGN